MTTWVNKRFCGHKSDMNKALSNILNKDAKMTALSKHFASSPHSEKDLKGYFLDNKSKWRETDQIAMEDFYMYKRHYGIVVVVFVYIY